MSDGVIIQQMVDRIAERNQEVFTRQQERDNDTIRRLVPVLMQKGVESMNLSMLEPELKKRLLALVGEEYFRKGQVKEAINAFVLSGNRAKLGEIGEHYELVGQNMEAIDCYKLAADEEHLISLGKKCLENFHLKEAMLEGK